ncbi:tyrosine-type recombinase/integrase [Pseudobacillus badius]|uniref:tyrosine-type recombinase/integrase n=1 Tax=Bacillus badius TaxID=1455 RepID=UPI0007B3DA7B|nr:tyrosine-type recombinase/integrase [Bacillus badius]KZR57545.1 integrase [Bacillus badius]
MVNVIDAYIFHLKEEGKDDKTVQSYHHVIREYYSRSGNEASITDARPIDVKEYISFLRHDKRLNPATVNKYITALNSFFLFLEEAGYIKENPMTRIKRVAIADSDSGESKWLTSTEQERFISYAELEPSDWLRTRNLAIIDLMLYAGLRVQEVVDLAVADISLNGKDVKVIVRDGKKGKYAVVTLVHKYSRNLKQWLKLRGECEKASHRNSPWLFVSERSEQITTRGIQKFMKKYGDLARMEGITPHRLRHSFCKNLALNDTPIEIIRRLARHESINTTAIYVDPSHEELIKSLRRI